MTFAIKPKKFSEIADDTSKRFSLEAFCFTYQFGLNIYFDDLDDLKEITKDVEFEFWLLRDDKTEAELSVDNFSTLKTLLDFLEEIDSDSERLIDTYEKLVAGKFASWDNVKEWHEENFVCEFKNNEDFGYYLIDELSCLNIPDEIQHYFDYESYGRDAFHDGYCKAAGNVYRNF